ncbi:MULTISPECIES: mechanosensitive ion channel family protein [unclassified Pseudomonas]|uniref:mechanosensitive ion channel family protein n=1 Tax=unclassified Pseudomonas TaxID=196821 RepID=UPI002AC97011|nr:MULTISPECIES: mechanosensitive ion channel family protein [unclassified Pseudomonas]MEB0042278.1 mechanosensitive ion channel family protein [Pseudomonas sp. MH10]MEB0122655.1 mechanosensitive ion channel family protein [Pseudomonas sp. CCI1.2]WPX65534.1 mechanosensitive ion channel family protein [Pseudomonas sp. MH10]
MDSLWFAYPLASASLFLVIDMIVWQWVDPRFMRRKMVVRLVLFLLFSVALLNGGLSPLFPVPEGFTPARHTVATLLAITWWLFGARALTSLAVVVLEPRIGGKGHLLQDLMGAIIFLVATVAAAAYVLDLPVKGLLATSGAVAIILGLAVQSTLGDVFSGIVLNATKPFRVDDVISVDDVEGKVIEIDWRSTYLLTSAGSMVVIPNAMAAKTRIVNLSRPGHFYSVVLTIELPVRLRPSLVLDSLEKALQGCRELLAKPKGGAVVKISSLRSVEYEITGYVKSRDRRDAVRNQLYDLIYRQLNASETIRQNWKQPQPATRQLAALNSVSALRGLSDEDRAELEQHMRLSSFPAGAIILPQGAVPESLLIIESGVVSVDIERTEGWCELGRMGPGEVMGESGIIDQSASAVRFTARTDCLVYLIDAKDLEPWLDQHPELRGVLVGLARLRAQARAAMLQQYKPVEIAPGGFLHWLRKNVNRTQPPR